MADGELEDREGSRTGVSASIHRAGEAERIVEALVFASAQPSVRPFSLSACRATRMCGLSCRP